MVMVTWNFGFLEIWVSHKLGSVKTRSDHLPTTGRVLPLISNSNDSPCSQGRKTPSGRKERTTYSPYKEKTEIVQKILGKSGISK